MSSAVALVGTAAAAAYLNAKLYLSKDISFLLQLRKRSKAWEAAVHKKRANIFYLFEENAQRWPNGRCLWSRSGCFTWREALDSIYRYGQYFLSLGCTPDTAVGVYLINTPEFVFIWLGLLSISCFPALVNYNLASDALIHAVRLGSFKVLVTDSEPACQARIQEEERRLKALGVSAFILSEQLKAEIASREPVRPDDSHRKKTNGTLPLALLYTSGTTGLSKALRFPMSVLYTLTLSHSGLLGLTPGPDGDICYDCMPMYHATGGFNALWNVCSGVQLAVGRSFSLHNFWRDVRDSNSTVIVYVGETIRYLLTNPPAPEDRAHLVRVAFGNGLKADAWRKFQDRFGIPEVCEFYGATDGMFSCRTWSRNEQGVGSVGHTGTLLNFLQRNVFVLAVLDPETNDVWRDPTTGFARRARPAEGGEMIVKLSDQMIWPGYVGDEAATEKKVARDVFKKGDAYQRLGDALKRDGDGFWYFMDRLGDTYRWKGENVSTTEVAECLGQFPGIDAVNVYGVLLPNHEGRAGCAAIVIAPAQRANFDWPGLLSHLRLRLPRYAVPIFVRVVERGVMSMVIHNNKPDITRLRAEGVDPSLLGSKVPQGGSDRILWLPSKDSLTYEPFLEDHWENLRQSVARL